MKENMLVTGASGFIGYNFVQMFKNKYYIKAIDKKGLDEQQYIEDFEMIDLTDIDALDLLMHSNHFDYVVNFAAEANVDDSITNPQKHVQNNIVGTLNLIDYCRNHKNLKRFHQVSTDEVYGDISHEDTKGFREYDRLMPGNPYAVTKSAADMMIQTYGRMYNFPFTISRCTNNFGIYQTIDKLIPRMITKCLMGEELTVHGDGSYMRDWLHVDDHCVAIDIILHQGIEKEIYNIRGYQEVSNIDMIKYIADIMSYPREKIVHVEDRPGNDRRYLIDSSKLELLGFMPEHSIGKTIDGIISWYKKNEDWWKPQLEVKNGY